MKSLEIVVVDKRFAVLLLDFLADRDMFLGVWLNGLLRMGDARGGMFLNAANRI